MKNACPKILKLVFLRKSVAAWILATTGPLAYAQYPGYKVPENPAGTHYMLGIIGYNYTDKYISGFSINGQGGGYVRLSSPTTGGSATVCCALLSKNPTWPMRVLIRWADGGCREYEKNRAYGHNRHYYRERMVEVERGTATQPADMAVHFFKDGSVRVMLSDGWEPPLLKLSEDRAKEVDFPECKPGEVEQYL